MASADDFKFFHTIRVRWAECDIHGVVFNPQYFVYFDVAMTEYMRGLGFEGPAITEYVTVHAQSDYAGSARFDDLIDVGVRCARLGRTSMTLEFVVLRDEELLTEGSITYVHVGPGPDADGAKPLPHALVDTVVAFEKAGPERASGGS